MFNTRCGCPYCKGQPVPTNKWGWKSRNNKHGRMYGTCGKPGAKPGARKQAH